MNRGILTSLLAFCHHTCNHNPKAYLVVTFSQQATSQNPTMCDAYAGVYSDGTKIIVRVDCGNEKYETSSKYKPDAKE